MKGFWVLLFLLGLPSLASADDLAPTPQPSPEPPAAVAPAAPLVLPVVIEPAAPAIATPEPVVQPARPAKPVKEKPLLQYKTGPATWTVSGETRARSEYRKDFAFQPDGGGQHAFYLLRTRLGLLAELPVGAAFVEGLDGRDLTDEASPKRQYNPLDLHQAWVELRKPAKMPVNLKVGRQELNLGARLLISSPVWANYVRSYDLVRATVLGSRWKVDAFGGRVVVSDPDAFDPWKDSEELWGLYGTLQATENISVEAYFLGLQTRTTAAAPIKGEDGKTGDLSRYTPGLRLVGSALDHALDFEAEVALQRGSRANDDVSSHAQHLSVAYRFATPMAPRVKVELNRASGDSDPKDGTSQTFVPLYGTSHDPYGMVDFFRWQNMEQAGLILSAHPHATIDAFVEGHLFALADAHDSWVDTGGNKLRAGRVNGGARTAGQELDARVAWTPSSHFKVDVGAARFLPGQLVDDTQAAGKDVGPADWVYLQVSGVL